MNQPSLISEAVICPYCKFSGTLDDFDCAGLPDGVLCCEQAVHCCSTTLHKSLRKHARQDVPQYTWSRCGCLFVLETGEEWDGIDDDA